MGVHDDGCVSSGEIGDCYNEQFPLPTHVYGVCFSKVSSQAVSEDKTYKRTSE